MRKLCLKVLQKLLRKPYSEYSNAYVELTGQDANDYILNAIHNSESGLMVSKWGTIELGTVCTLLRKELNIPIMDILRGKVPIDEQAQLNWLIKNSGFFPNDIEQARRFCYMVTSPSCPGPASCRSRVGAHRLMLSLVEPWATITKAKLSMGRVSMARKRLPRRGASAVGSFFSGAASTAGR